MPVVLEAKDGDFARGTCGLGTDKTFNGGVYFAHI